MKSVSFSTHFRYTRKSNLNESRLILHWIGFAICMLLYIRESIPIVSPIAMNKQCTHDVLNGNDDDERNGVTK